MQSTLTVSLPVEVNNRLGDLARRTHRASSVLAVEAITAFVDRELDIVDGIERGLEDVRAGRVVPHDEAMRQLRATINSAAADPLR